MISTRQRSPLLATTLIVSLLIGPLSMLSACSKPSEEEYFNRAKAALAEDNQATAVIELKNVLLINGTNNEARWLLGKAYLALLDGPSAEKELRKAMEQGLSEDSAILLLAQAYYLQGKHEDIVKLKLPKTLQSPEHKAHFLVLKGRAYLALSNPLASERLFLQAADITPNDTRLNTAIAELKFEQFKYTEARQILAQVLEANPRYIQAWRQLALLEQQQGNFEATVNAYTKVIEYSEHNGQDLAQRALVYIQLNRIDNAKDDLVQARKKLKDAPIINFASGVIATLENRHQDAKEALQKVLYIAPDHMPATFYLGLTAYNNDELELAKTSLTTYHRKYPDSVSANKLLGGISLALGDQEAAAIYLRKANASDPEDIESMRLLGKIALGKGSSTEAIAYFNQVIEQEANNPENYLELGKSYRKAGKTSMARKEYERALALDPELRTAEYGIIASYLDNGEFQVALNYVADLQQKRPEDIEPLILKSAIHIAMGNKQTAIETLKQALTLTPGDQAASHNLANLILQDSDFEGARKLYLGVLELHPEHVPTIMRLARVELISGHEQDALKLVKKAFKLDPSSLEVLSTLTSYHLKQGHPKKAMQLITQVPAKDSDKATFYELLAKTEIALSQYHTANKTLSKLLKLQPRSAEGYFLLAKVNAQLADGDTVVANLQKTLELDPSHFEARLALARMYANNGAFEQSNAMLASMASMYGSHPQVLYLMGLRELRNNNNEYAYELFSQAVNIEALGEYVIALSNAQFRLRNTDEAIDTLKTWMKKNPNDLAVQYHLANALLLLEKNDEAIVEFRNALRIKPDSIGALNNLAWLIREKSPDEAEKLASQSLTLAPKSAQASHTLAEIKLNQHKPKEALALLKTAIDSNPNNYHLEYSLAKALKLDGQAAKARTLYDDLLGRGDVTEAVKKEIRADLSR